MQSFIREVRRGDPITAEKVNELIQAVNASKVVIGKGLEGSFSSRGIVLKAKPKEAPRGGGTASNLRATGPTQTMGFTQDTQDTDEYVYEDSGGIVEVKVITDIAFKESSGELVFRYRTLSFDIPPKSISAESDEVVITVAEVCP